MIFKDGGENKRKQGENQEKKLAKKLGMKLQSGSGAPWHKKGDIKGEIFLIESKNTEKDSMQIKKSWLDKIEREAHRYGKIPLLIIGFGTEYYTVRRMEE